MVEKTFSLLLWLFILFPNGIKSPCGPGTLKCLNPGDPNNSRAIICDPSLNYVLFQHSCIQQIIPNCLLTIDENKCKVCQFGK